MITINKEYEALIPKLQDEEFEQLEENIKLNGCLDDIKITPGNVIIDGHNRFNICNKLGIEFNTKVVESDDYIRWIIEHQFGRRNINNYQRSVLALRLKDRLAEIGKEKIIENNIVRADPTLQKSANRDAHDTRQEISKKANVSHDTISKVEIIEREAPEEIKMQLSKGETTINKEYQKIKEKKDKEIKRQKYEEKVLTVSKEESDNKVDISITTSKFRVIYADPCWSYNDKQNTNKLGGASKHYDTMSIKELCELPIKRIKEDDSILFLWVTSPLLEESFQVIKEWGFKYKTSFIWDKVKHNMGHYNSVRHEFLLVCTSGSCTPDNKKLYDSVQSIERNDNHSEKPIEFMDIIDDIYEYGNKIELFARDKKKQDWFFWGNEV